jgi:type I restriction enzyme, R subunit
VNKKGLSERDICSKIINPAIVKSGWKENYHFREEVSFNTFTDGKVIVK